MSVEKREPIKMPQPEQWMSEHPFWQLVIFASIVGVPFLLGWWL